MRDRALSIGCLVASSFVIASQGAIWFYLVVLLRRTQWLERETSIGADTVAVIYASAILSCVGAGLLFWKTPIDRRLTIALFALAILALILFAALNASGRAGPWTKEWGS